MFEKTTPRTQQQLFIRKRLTREHSKSTREIFKFCPQRKRATISVVPSIVESRANRMHTYYVNGKEYDVKIRRAQRTMQIATAIFIRSRKV